MPTTGINSTDMHQATAEVESFFNERIDTRVMAVTRKFNRATQPVISCQPAANGGRNVKGEFPNADGKVIDLSRSNRTRTSTKPFYHSAQR